MSNDGAAHGAHWLRRLLASLLALGAGGAFLLVVHNYGISLLPAQVRIIAPDEIQPDLPGPSFAYSFSYTAGVPDQIGEPASRAWLSEDGQPYFERLVPLDAITRVGGSRFAHLEGRILFATKDNTDPRTNGRIYRVHSSILYSHFVGRSSAVALVLCLLGLWWARPAAVLSAPAAAPAGWSRRGRWLGGAAAVVFAAGLYCNTGTLTPYAVTFSPYIDPATGHAYNQDHVHFRVLYQFMDGQPRAVWDKALLLRRILYPAVTYPAMKVLGFEAGGVVMNLLLNVGAFLGSVWWLRRRVGERGAIFAAWLLATYPGFAYWVGMPYQYAIIGPGSILLTIALAEILDSGSLVRIRNWSLIMGLVYLAYDFAPVFLPATILMLWWRRRWRDAAVALGVQVLPLACWMLTLKYGLGQSLENSNTSVYRGVVGGLSAVHDWGQWLGQRVDLWDAGAATFFGANFVFLPAIFLGALLASRWTARVRLADSEWPVFAATLALFVVINIGEKTGGWSMSGSWISRLYQPVFPAMVFFLARWWQALPPLPGIRRGVLVAGLGLATAGNLLVITGPIFRNPLGVSEEVFFRFYTHSNAGKSKIYETMLHELPRQTFGLGHPQAKPGP